MSNYEKGFDPDFIKKNKDELKTERRADLQKERGNTYIFNLGLIDADTVKTINELNKALSGMGVEFELAGQNFQGYDLNFLEITIKKNNIKNIRTRYAGRPEKPVYYMDPETDIKTKATVNKVRALIDEYGALDAAGMIGMSKAGMYKRLGKAESVQRPCPASDLPLGEDDLTF